MDSFPRDALFFSVINLNRTQDSMARMVPAIAIHPDGHSKTLVNHCSHLSIVFEQLCCITHHSDRASIGQVCTSVCYLKVATFVFISRLRVHDRSSNKVMSLGQDPNPVHSPPMIELGLEGSVFTSSMTVYLVGAFDLA